MDQQNIVVETTSLLEDSARDFTSALAEYLPSIIGAFLLLVLGGIVALILARITKKTLRLLGAEKFEKNKAVSSTKKQLGISSKIVDIIGATVKWLTMVVFAMAAVDVLGLSALRDVFREILAYIPNILAASIVLAATIVFSRIVRDFVTASLDKMQFDRSKPVATVAQGVVVVLGSVVALAQLGFNTTILTANVTVILAGAVLTFVLAFGIGGREQASNLLSGYSVKNMYKKGDKFVGDGVRGEVKEIHMFSMLVETNDGTAVVPYSRIMKS